MYESFKQIARAILPLRLIRQNEKQIRMLISFLYAGSAYACNICGFRMSRFVKLANGEKLCPRCGSLPRTRRLWSLTGSETAGKDILDFSPPRCFREMMEAGNAKSYITTDYAGEFKAAKRLNIAEIDEPDHSYDLIICYHVLEHVVQDGQAMRELYRILKPGGKCYIQTPFKAGDIYENNSITTPEGRLQHFGQEDHVRVYSAAGLADKLRAAGFRVSLKQFKEAPDNRFGYKAEEMVLVAEKPAATTAPGQV